MNIKNPNSERTKRMELLQKLYKGEVSLETIKREYTELYLSSMDQFESVNKMYYKDNNPTPEGRLNLVLTGTGGSGKSTLSHLIPKALNYKENQLYTFTDIEAGFLNYTNEKVVIWDEGRTWKLNTWGIEKFLTATNTGKYNNSYINIKYGAVKLAQELNIINSSQKNREFLLGLTDRHTEWNQELCYKQLTDPENIDQINRRFEVLLDTDKKILPNGTYNTYITCYQWDKQKENSKEFTHYSPIFKVVIPTTEDNYEEQLKIFAKFIASFINIKKHKWDFTNLKEYFLGIFKVELDNWETIEINKLNWDKIKKDFA